MNGDRLIRVPPGTDRDAYWDLLLLADESEQQVRSYMNEGELFALFVADSPDPAGMTLAIPLGDGEVELKAVAVAPAHQNKGVGKRMLALVLEALREDGYSRVIVGTANAGIGQLAFYQKAGFRLHHIERDFFGVERGYPTEFFENGIQLLDMVWMDCELQPAG